MNFIEQNPVVLEGAIMNFYGEAGPETTQGDLQAQVVWHTDTDIDLYLITPGSGVVSYNQQSISLSGRSEAILDWDNSEGEIDYGEDTRFENIAVTGDVPDGFYQFFAEDCCSDSGNTTDVTLTVTDDGGTSGLRDTFTLTENSPTTTTDTTDIFAVEMVDGEAQSYHRGEMPADQYNYIAPFDSGGSQEAEEEISF
ncbi:hypothetical protein BOW53_04385 [Solemya pervernicosa gill symbiont]|uniref:Uncharacterized protein n=2 Tax=Gammaproteobacteria incertae sedis TaxID=118884 RepID=A0A1T2L8E6_9GAMM|nr:hypothetical protein [Candidatus Reidiella endopervernicosa]OOZ41359.1 hypothetical protein BOW53_04385 [Solemya pervernicosa gill symbiont]QKQ27737.1 hypothetical protein HUE57_16675 [Candidatus Reidiella endopervernicosa]